MPKARKVWIHPSSAGGGAEFAQMSSRRARKL